MKLRPLRGSQRGDSCINGVSDVFSFAAGNALPAVSEDAKFPSNVVNVEATGLHPIKTLRVCDLRIRARAGRCGGLRDG